MRYSFRFPVVLAMVSCSLAVVGQTASPAAVASVQANGATEAPVARPSQILQASLTRLQQALSGIRLEKWKMSGELRDAADADLRSIERDFRETLPPLLTTADSDPGSVAKVLPVLRNIDAVYDVALRVSAMGRLTAPAQQSAALDEALQQLSDARRQVGDGLQQAAVAQDGRMTELQASLKASQAALATAQANATATPAPATKPVTKPKKKVRPKPTTTTAAGATPTAGAAATGTTK